jgi:isocitrate dehydrogenase
MGCARIRRDPRSVHALAKPWEEKEMSDESDQIPNVPIRPLLPADPVGREAAKQIVDTLEEALRRAAERHLREEE